MTEKVIKSPSRTYISKYSPSRNQKLSSTSILKRKSSSQEEEEETITSSLSRSSTFSSDIQTDSNNNTTRWTTAHWKKLEDWYVRKNRDFRKAANSFYYFESLINIELPKEDNDINDGAPITKELWTLDHILWRSQCLDTSVKFHQGLLPSERKKEKKRKLNGSISSSSSSSSSTLSFKRPVTPAARISSSRPTTPARPTSVSISPKTTTTPVRRIPSYNSSVSFD